MPRQCISLAAALLLLLAARTAPAAQAKPEHKPEVRPVLVIDRLTFGTAPGLAEHIATEGPAAFIEEQLTPQSVSQPETLTRILEKLPLNTANPVELFRVHSRARETDPSKPEAVIREAGRQALTARLARAVLSPRQLYEIMVGFWQAFFLPDSAKGLARLWAGAFEREAVRPFAIWRFEDLLLAAVRHPAMLLAHDNWLSSPPGTPGIKDAPGGVNPQLARTILKDMTIGPGFDQKDVSALALILTGWGLGAPREAGDENGVAFDASRHAKGAKKFLGVVIEDGARKELPQAIKHLAANPATAKYVCTRIAAFFLGEEPPQPLLAKLTKTYRDRDGAIRDILAALFDSREFAVSAKNRRHKDDFEYLAGLVRALGGEGYDLATLAQNLESAGYPLFGRLSGLSMDFTSPGKETLALRKRLAASLAKGEFRSKEFTAAPMPSAEDFLRANPGIIGEKTLRRIQAAPEAERLTLILQSDDLSAK